jgi:hypothetical protein
MAEGFEPRNKRPLTMAELEAQILETNRNTKQGTDLFAGAEERRAELNSLAPDTATGDKTKI